MFRNARNVNGSCAWSGWSNATYGDRLAALTAVFAATGAPDPEGDAVKLLASPAPLALVVLATAYGSVNHA